MAPFVNTVGHLSGVLLFGLLIALLIRGWGRSADRQRVASLVAALLAFVWNAGSLLGLASAQRDGQVAAWLVAFNFSVLSFLPAILFQVAFRKNHPRLARIGYVLGIVSTGLHFLDIRFPSAGLQEAALLVIAVGFSALIAGTLVAGYVTCNRRVSLTDAACLLLFTLSFLHFGYGHEQTAWTNEVAWHHASIPLALIVLLRDYRVLFLETFIRFVANFGLAGLYGFSIYWGLTSGHLIKEIRRNEFALGALAVLFSMSLVLFAYLRSVVQKQLTRRLFRRGDVNAHLNSILRIASSSETEQELLNRAAAELSAFVNAEASEVVPESAAEQRSWAELSLPLRFSRGDSIAILLGRRAGSGRYLAEDIDALNRMAALVTEQVERFRGNELQRLAREAELRALQAQINPHFLFNALNTLYGIIGREAFEARRFILNLADLLRYCLHHNRTLISLGEELSIVQAYLEIESLRLGDRLRTEISVPAHAREVLIPILSLQPLVENAIKHGIARRSAGGEIRISADEAGPVLLVRIEDNGPGFRENSSSNGLGMGLTNVRQRLHLYYGPAASLEIDSSENGTRATLAIPLASPNAVPISEKSKSEAPECVY